MFRESLLTICTHGVLSANNVLGKLRRETSRGLRFCRRMPLSSPTKLDTDNFRNRVLHKVARKLQLPKLTFQFIRTTIATLAQKKGTVKDIQGVLRHSRTATTTDVYMQEIPESVQSTINSINLELRKSSAESPETPKKAASTGLVVRSRRKPSASVTQDDTKSWEGGSASLPACASF